jgi:hypothetical protein
MASDQGKLRSNNKLLIEGKNDLGASKTHDDVVWIFPEDMGVEGMELFNIQTKCLELMFSDV